MKKFASVVFTVLVSSQLFATIHTVCNVPSTLAQFSSIQAACDAANSGDSIYVIGTPIAYAAFTIADKKLAIFGPGWSPDKQLPLTTVVQGCTFTGAGATGSEVHGLTFNSTLSIQTIGINDLKFVRNRFMNLNISVNPSVAGPISGYLFEGNWFDNAGVNTNSNYTPTNFLFQNNIFFENGCCVNGSISGFVNAVNVLVDHNLFYGPSSGSRAAFTGNCRFLTISNNIFEHRDAATDNSFSTFTNNLTFNTTNDLPWTVNSNVDGGGNLGSTDPQMVDQTSVNNGVNNPLLNFTIAAGAANNAGTDGKDLGLLFDATGSLNWTTSRGARLPFISIMNITTPTVAPGGNISVTVEAKKNN